VGAVSDVREGDSHEGLGVGPGEGFECPADGRGEGGRVVERFWFGVGGGEVALGGDGDDVGQQFAQGAHCGLGSGGVEERGEAFLKAEQSRRGRRLGGVIAEVGAAAMVAASGGVGQWDIAGDGLRCFDVLEQRSSALSAVAAGTGGAEQGAVGGAGEVPGKPPSGLPSAVGVGQAGWAVSAPAHRLGHPFVPARAEACLDEGLVADQGPPHRLELFFGEAGGRGHGDELADTLAEGDIGGRLTPEPGSWSEAGGQVEDWGVESGGVGGHPTVERLARQRWQPDRQAPGDRRRGGGAHAAPELDRIRAESRPWSIAACSSTRAASAASSLRMWSIRSLVSRSSPVVAARRQPRVM
jgi:hypothetical protein